MDPLITESAMNEDKDILTIEEAAQYLSLGKRSVYKLAKSGQLPAKMVLNKWRFEREALRDWIRKGGK
jgi:excisionase family DNA binding protein